MSNRIAGVSEKLVECAKEEFLEKGFDGASLRTVAKNAETSTSSIYIRFGDKDGLLMYILKPVTDEFVSIYRSVQQDFSQLPSNVQSETVNEYSANGMLRLIDYIYDNTDIFRILLDSSCDKFFRVFEHELIDIELEYTLKFMDAVGCRSFEDGKVTTDFLHIIISSFFNGFFEPVRHGMSREEAYRYIGMLSKYHRAGVACHAKRKKMSSKTQKIPFKMTFGYILKGIFLSMQGLNLLMKSYC